MNHNQMMGYFRGYIRKQADPEMINTMDETPDALTKPADTKPAQGLNVGPLDVADKNGVKAQALDSLNKRKDIVKARRRGQRVNAQSEYQTGDPLAAVV